MPPRTSPDRRAASSQLKSADPSARVGKATRAKEANGELIVPLVYKGADGKNVSKDFRLADDVGIMPLMEWVSAAEGKSDENAKSLIAIFHVLEDTVHEDDWDDFRQYSREHKVKAPSFGEFINSALEALAGRPTEEPSGSSDG